MIKNCSRNFDEKCCARKHGTVSLRLHHLTTPIPSSRHERATSHIGCHWKKYDACCSFNSLVSALMQQQPQKLLNDCSTHQRIFPTNRHSHTFGILQVWHILKLWHISLDLSLFSDPGNRTCRSRIAIGYNRQKFGQMKGNGGRSGKLVIQHTVEGGWRALANEESASKF
jgi:hypothetical protein